MQGENSSTIQTVQANIPAPTVTEIATVALKLPPFWFVQIESQFVMYTITNQDTKFHHIVASLTLFMQHNRNQNLNGQSSWSKISPN